MGLGLLVVVVFAVFFWIATVDQYALFREYRGPVLMGAGIVGTASWWGLLGRRQTANPKKTTEDRKRTGLR